MTCQCSIFFCMILKLPKLLLSIAQSFKLVGGFGGVCLGTNCHSEDEKRDWLFKLIDG